MKAHVLATKQNTQTKNNIMKNKCQDKDNGGCIKNGEYILTIENVKNQRQSLFCAEHALQLVYGKLVMLEKAHEPESEHIVLIPLSLLK